MTQESPEVIHIVTKQCLVCEDPGLVKMPKEAYDAWVGGAFIQDAWPQADRATREQLISGVHPDCWFDLRDEEQEK